MSFGSRHTARARQLLRLIGGFRPLRDWVVGITFWHRTAVLIMDCQDPCVVTREREQGLYVGGCPNRIVGRRIVGCWIENFVNWHNCSGSGDVFLPSTYSCGTREEIEDNCKLMFTKRGSSFGTLIKINLLTFNWYIRLVTCSGKLISFRNDGRKF